jgi:rhodanese-related sulfurtransferase
MSGGTLSDATTVRTSSSEGYAGDIPAAEIWQHLAGDTEAVLIDVRTNAEWSYVGVPDLTSLDKRPLNVSWKLFPAMIENTDFQGQLEAAGLRPGQRLFFLCRSGVRSRAAARAMTEAGLGPCYNISDGFEGDRSEAKRRGAMGGWRHAGLPWVQE